MTQDMPRTEIEIDLWFGDPVPAFPPVPTQGELTMDPWKDPKLPRDISDIGVCSSCGRDDVPMVYPTGVMAPHDKWEGTRCSGGGVPPIPDFPFKEN